MKRINTSVIVVKMKAQNIRLLIIVVLLLLDFSSVS